jgi:hypothetical protein
VDPNVTLANLRDALAECDSLAAVAPDGVWADAAADALAAFRDLDAWLSAGGAIPAEWAAHRGDR